MRRGEPLPRVWLAPGAVRDPRGLLRLGELRGIPLPVGPVTGSTAVPGPVRAGVGGVEHADDPGTDLTGALDLVRWCGGRGLTAVVAVRGERPGEAAAVVEAVRRSPDADAVGAVEVDLRAADDQHALRVMARVREVTPRDHLLLARLSAQQRDLVPVARAAVAGGAGAVVVCGSVRLGDGRWWSGASTLAVTRTGVRTLAGAAQEQRWPAVPLIAAGGVHDSVRARELLAAGAAAVQLGTALWADPTLLWTISEELRSTP